MKKILFSCLVFLVISFFTTKLVHADCASECGPTPDICPSDCECTIVSVNSTLVYDDCGNRQCFDETLTSQTCSVGNTLCWDVICTCGTGCDAADSCSTREDCNDADPCTEDYCSYGNCLHYYLPDCGGCRTSAECNDNDPCTLDDCSFGYCYNDYKSYLPGCGGTLCFNDSDCDDGNSCTDDQCAKGDCYNFYNSSLPGCGGGGGGIVPEPISSILFITGGLLLAGRRYSRKKRM